VPTNNKSLTGPGAVSGKGGSPSRKATFHITADAIAATPDERHDSLEKSSYVIWIDRSVV